MNCQVLFCLVSYSIHNTSYEIMKELLNIGYFEVPGSKIQSSLLKINTYEHRAFLKECQPNYLSIEHYLNHINTDLL